MARDCCIKYRGFPSLTPECKAKLIGALSVGAPVEIAYESVGISKNTFYRWRRAGDTLYHGEECKRYTAFPVHASLDDSDAAV